MYRIEKSYYGHQWDKVNLVTLTDQKGGYDLLKCKCGVHGRSYDFTTVCIPETFKVDIVTQCAFHKVVEAKTVKITNCRANGPAFGNITPESIHQVIDSPNGNYSDRSVWVMGVGEPVRILLGEFEVVETV